MNVQLSTCLDLLARLGNEFRELHACNEKLISENDALKHVVASLDTGGRAVTTDEFVFRRKQQDGRVKFVEVAQPLADGVDDNDDLSATCLSVEGTDLLRAVGRASDMDDRDGGDVSNEQTKSIIGCRRETALPNLSCDSIKDIPLVDNFPVAWDFYFVPASFILKQDKQKPLPHHQELRRQNIVTKKRCSLEDVFLGRLRDTHAVVSYRWHGDQNPDPHGVRLEKLQQHLRKNPRVQWVWMDWLCLPQTISRDSVHLTKDEKKLFDKSLTMVNLLFLGCMVFIIFDNQYSGRFWPSIEAWMSLQDINDTGFFPEDNRHSRRTRVECIGASASAEAHDEAERFLLKVMGDKDLRQVIEVLKEDDILVTNKKDKQVQFDKLRELESRVGDLFERLVKPEEALTLKAERARRRQLTLLSLWSEEKLDLTTSPQSFRKSRSMVLAEAIVQKREANAMLACIISHSGSNFWLSWECCGAVLILWDCVTVPLFVFERSEDVFTTVVDWVSLIFWTFNVVTSLLVGYTTNTPNGIVMEMRLSRIACRYFRTWFVIDVVTLVPDWTMTIAATRDTENTKVTGQNVGQVGRVLRLVRIVRLVRFPKLLWVLSRVVSQLDSEYIILFSHLVVMILVLVCTAHLIACIWFLVSDSATSVHEATWIIASRLKNAHWSAQYLSSLHWAVAHFSLASIDVAPQNNSEKVCAVIVAIVALVGFSCFVGKVGSLLMRLQKLSDNESRKIIQVRRYLLSNRVSNGLGVRIQRQLESVVQRKKARGQAPDILKDLSPSLYGELQWVLMSPFLVAHPLFKFLDRVSQASTCESVGIGQTLQFLVRDIAEKKYLPASDTYFSQGTRGNCVAFPISGRFSYDQPGTHETKPEEPIEAPSRHGQQVWFSEPVLWASSWVHLGTLTTLTEVDMVHFHLEGKQLVKFCNIIKQNPFVFEKARQYAQRFMSWINEKKAKESFDFSDVMHEGCVFDSGDLFDPPTWAPLPS